MKLKEEKIDKLGEGAGKMVEAYQEHRSRHMCIQLRSRTFKESMVRVMDKIFHIVLDICTTSYGPL